MFAVSSVKIHSAHPTDGTSRDDDAYNTTLSSAILPSMDLSDMFLLDHQGRKPQVIEETPWQWHDHGGSISSSQSTRSLLAASTSGQIATTTSPRQRHGFSQPFLQDASLQSSWVSEKSCRCGQSPVLPVVQWKQPPSPGCSKKSRTRRRQLRSYLIPSSLRRMFSFDPTVWSSQWLWLLLYFSFNLLLTLSNKSVLTTFPFPYTLTGLHTLCSTIGCAILQTRGVYTPKPLTSRNRLVLAAFSILYAINITVSNVSLQLVTVPVRFLLIPHLRVAQSTRSFIRLSEHSHLFSQFSYPPCCSMSTRTQSSYSAYLLLFLE